MFILQRVYIHIHTTWLYTCGFSLCLLTPKMEPCDLTAPLKAVLIWLLSNLLTKPPCALFFPPQDTSPIVSQSTCPSSNTRNSFLPRTLSLFFPTHHPSLSACSLKWLVHSYVLGVSPYVTHSGKPLKLALSHHPIGFYQSTDLYLKLCAYYLITVPHIHKIVSELQGVLSFVHHCISSSLKGCIQFIPLNSAVNLKLY